MTSKSCGLGSLGIFITLIVFKRDNILNFWVVRPGIINVIFNVKSTVGRMITPKSYFKATVIKTVVCVTRTDKKINER